MKMYDQQFNDIVTKALDSFGDRTPRVWEYSPELQWPASDGPNMTDKSGAALEIGGALRGGANFVCATADPEYELKDQILLYGPDLSEIRGDTPLGRITVLKLDDEGLEERELFNIMVDMDMVKHHVQPDGYTVDFIQAARYEIAHISEKALRDGISFARVGACYIAGFKKNPRIKAVTEIFITDPTYDFGSSELVAKKMKSMLFAMRAHCTVPTQLRS
jgi:hypothetical protein